MSKAEILHALRASRAELARFPDEQEALRRLDDAIAVLLESIERGEAKS